MGEMAFVNKCYILIILALLIVSLIGSVTGSYVVRVMSVVGYIAMGFMYYVIIE